MRTTAVAQSRYTPFIPPQMAAKVASVPAPVKGWDTETGLAQMPADHAIQIDNWIPRAGYCEPRRGFEVWSTGVGSATQAVETLMAYTGPTANKMFAVAKDGKIYDVTANSAASATTVTGLTNFRWQYTNFTNDSGTSYLVCGNGVDLPKVYDGSTWASMTITISGYSDEDIVQPHVHQGRLWFVLKDSTDVAYLPIGAISGTASVFPLGPLMSFGGYIMAMASWTADTQQTVSDYAVFITSQGQALVYMGNDPDTAFALVGVYDLGPPIGRRCFLKVGGDVAIISIDGVLPMSKLISTDRAAADNIAITSNISTAMAEAAYNYASNFGWELVSYPKGTLAILNVPQVENEQAVQFVMNTLTGAWCRFIGINANCWETLGNYNIFFGGNDGTVYRWDVGSGDDDEAISATVKTAFNYFNTRGRLKNLLLLRPTITSDDSVLPGVAVNADFQDGAVVSIPDPVSTEGALWDVARWDMATWPVVGSTSSVWQSVSATGQCFSIVTSVQTLSNGSEDGVLLQLNSWDVSYEMGGLI